MFAYFHTVKKILFKSWERKILVSSFVFFLLFSMGVKLFASYAPGATLNPACAPGIAGCIVTVIPDQTGNAGLYLTTDGAGNTSWAPAAAGGLTSLNGDTAGIQIFDFGTTDLTLNSSGGIHTFSWSAPLRPLNGGTGLAGLGSPNDFLGMNATGDQLEYKTFLTGTGNTNNDFNIEHSGATIVFNIPDASASDRGVVTTGAQTLAGQKTFTSLPLVSPNANPTLDNQLTTKSYVDTFAAGLSVRQSVTVATTGPLTLASNFENGDTVDGVTLASGDRVLIKDQSTGSQNGIYTVNVSGAPTRATDYDDNAEVATGTFTSVVSGTANANTQWVLVTPVPITVGSTALSFSKLSSQPAYTAGTGLSLSSLAFSLDTAHQNTWTTQQTFNNFTPILGTMTAGSVLFAGASKQIAQDNSNFFWDDSANFLGLGTTVPAYRLHIAGTTNIASGALFERNDAGSNISALSINPFGSASSGQARIGFSLGNTPSDTQNVFTLGFNGDFGIGTTTPSKLFQVTRSTVGPGTVTVTSGSTAVTGTNTQFTDTYKVGDSINVGGSQTKVVASVASDTSLAVTVAWTINATNSAYSVPGGERFAVKGTGDLYQNGSFFATQNTTLNNIRLGSGSGNDTITGNNITLLGINAGQSLTSGTDDTFIGKDAGKDNTTGIRNTFMGFAAGQKNISGFKNTFIGYAAGTQTTTGDQNTFIGSAAGGLSNTTGSKNVFVGTDAGFNNTVAVGNTFVGYAAGLANTAGYNNAFFGGNVAGSNTTGNNNTFIGPSAGAANTTGFSNIYIGSNAQIAGSSGVLTAATVIGNSAAATASHQLVIGSSSPFGNLNDGYFGAGVTSPATVISGFGVTGGGTYSSSGNALFDIVITANGTPDTFSWTETGGMGGTGGPTGITGGAQTLADGISVTFGSTTGNIIGVHYKVAVADQRDFTMNATGGSGTDVTGANLTFAGGKATGNATGGSLIFKTSDALGTSTGSSLQPLTQRMSISSLGDVTIASNDMGNGVTFSGPILTIGRNTNATNTAAGAINFLSKSGTAGYTWQDAAGNLRINTSIPTNGNDTAGVVIGAQTSTRDTKQDITDYSDYSGALDMIANAPLHTFRYIREVNGYGTDNPLAKAHIGFIADEVPAQFMQGNVIDQVSINGLLIASIKELNIKLQSVAGLTAGGSGSVVDQLVGTVLNLKELIVEKLTIGSSAKPTAITVYDKNGNPGCMTIEDVNSGATKITPGVCTDVAPVTPVVPSTPSVSDPISTPGPIPDTVVDPDPALVSDPVLTPDSVPDPVPETPIQP